MESWGSSFGAKHDLIGRATSVEEIIRALARRGCSDLTSVVDLGACSDLPCAGGGFCDVYQGTLHGGTIVAIKSLRVYDRPGGDGDRIKLLKRAARELYHWSKLQHRNVLPLLGLTIFRGHISMVSEWMEHGSLMSYLRLNPNVDRISLCVGVCEGLCYIHMNNMVHGDLKAANIMVSSKGTPLIADFGNAQLKDITLKFSNTTKAGLSIRWAAPELLLEDAGPQASKETDVYAYGMTGLEAITGDVPYTGINDNRVICLVAYEHKLPPRPAIDMHDDFWDILNSCWARNPSDRPKITTVRHRLQALVPSVSGTGQLQRGCVGVEDKGNSNKEPGQLWIHSVSRDVINSVSDQEKKRQEAINEVIYTERDFVRDLEYLRDRWMNPLRTEEVIPYERRDDFVTQVFWNIEDILDVNTRLCDLLTKRQSARPVVETIGDIFLELVPRFEPFVMYGKHQLYGKYEFEKEKSTNPAFAAFVETVERLPESRKLELNGYLTKPTTRLARYPLLLEVVLKHTPEDNVDRVAIPKAVKVVREFLGKMNQERENTENRFMLLQLDKSLLFRPGEEVDLKLKDSQRQLLYKGQLKRHSKTKQENIDIQVFLFDHALLIGRGSGKKRGAHERLKVFKRPIPLQLISVSTPKENAALASGHAASDRPDSEETGYKLDISYLGKKGYSLRLLAPTVVARRKWVEHITAQQDAMRGRSMVFDTFSLSEDVFIGDAKVNCAVPYDYGRQIAYGTDSGVYFQSLHEGQNRTPVRRLELLDVQQIDVLEEYQLLIVLSERTVITFPLEALDMQDPTKRMKRIVSHASFFKAGYCLGRTLVCVVKAGSLSSTIKTLEPIDQSIRARNKPTFKKLPQGGNETLKVFKEFYIPTESHSIHFLKTKLCVACAKGFEIVDLETLNTQILLDPTDASLDFVQRREDVRPLSIYRIDGEFLLCYNEFAFYVNKSGWRSKRDVTIYWEGAPTAFALHYPYVMAFDPTFVEIRHVDDGALVQVIRGNNLRLLFADTQPSVMNSSDLSSTRGIRGGTSTVYSHGGHSSQHGYSPYGQGQYSPYNSPVYGHAPHMATYAQPQQRQRRAHDRDEIILVSDDKVMAVRPAAPPPRKSDASSHKA